MTETNWQTSNTLCDLSHLGLLQLSGEDARTFLQGQVTNDVNQLDDSHAHLSAYCSPKGRMLALFLAFVRGDDLFLQLDSGIIEAIAKRLRMYVMRAKVEITDISSQKKRFSINGPDASKILGNVFPQLPNNVFETAVNDDAIIIQLPSLHGQQRYELVIEEDKAEAVWQQLATACQAIEKAGWDWLDIQTGIPEIYAETQEQFVPQMVNLDLLDGINFKKGCYTGQEIVARTHYLGTVKRRTYLASITTDTAPAAGDKVQDGAENEVGQIVRIAPNPDGSYAALIEMRMDAQEAGNISWQSTPIVFNDLPYKLESEDAAS